jgi:hypothetical protein
MKRAIAGAFWRALAVIALLGGVLAAAEIAGHRQRGQLLVATGVTRELPDSAYRWSTPWWVYPFAVAIGVLGLVPGALLYRGRAQAEVPRAG